MTTDAERPKEPPRPPFYKSSTLIPYHLQVVQFNGTTIRNRSAGERARAYLVRRSLSLRKRALNKSEASAPVVPAIDPVHSQQTTGTTTPASTLNTPGRSESRQSLLKRAKTPSRPPTAQSNHKHRKTLSRSQSLQLAAAEDPRLKIFAPSELEFSVKPLALRSGDSPRNSRLISKEASSSRETSIKRVASKVKSTAKTTATRLGRVFHHRRLCRRAIGRPRTKSKPPLGKIPIALDESHGARPKSTGLSLQCMPTPQVLSKAQERLHQPTQRSCSAWEVDILGTMLKRAFRYGHTDFSDLRPIGRLLARCSGTLSFKLEKVYPSGCKVLQRMYSRDSGREDDMATLIPPVEVPALIARPDAAATTTGATSWFVVGIEGPPLKGKPGLRSQIKLGIAGEIVGHYQMAGLAPDFRVCCLSRRQVKTTERSLRQYERQLGTPSAAREVYPLAEWEAHRSAELEAQVVRSMVMSDAGSIDLELLNDLLNMYTER